MAPKQNTPSNTPGEGGTEGEPTRPAPQAFTDFREYLRAMVAYLKATQPKFSYRYFSRVAGYSSPNFLKLVAEGQRNLSPGSVSRFAAGLGLTPGETDAFEALVAMGQATSDADRNRHYARLRTLDVGRGGAADRACIHGDQYDVYSHWYGLPLRELLTWPQATDDPAELGRSMRPPIKASTVRRTLQLLERVGLAIRDAAGRLRASERSLATKPAAALAVRNYHRAMLELSGRALDKVPVSERNITSLTVTLSRSQYEMVCDRLVSFRRELMAQLDDPDAPGGFNTAPDDSREVYVMGFQLVPVTQTSQISKRAPDRGRDQDQAQGQSARQREAQQQNEQQTEREPEPE